MDLIEILFIALFLLIPLLQGILGKGRGGAPDETAGRDRSARPDPRAEREGQLEPDEIPTRRPPRSEPAAEMLPDDLWEMLTGEKRERTPVATESPPETDVEAWTTEPAWSPEYEERTVEGPTDWRRPLPAAEADWSPLEPESLEVIGPEAYSLEQPLPPPEIRHARFHDKIEQGEITGDQPSRRRGRSSLVQTLRSRSGMRDAVILAEILGRPKGME